MSLYGKETELEWFEHDTADVAVLRLNPKRDVKAHLGGHFMPTKMFLDELRAPDRGRSVTILGFPLGLGIYERFSPI
jgi:hypothetical protein